MTKLTQSERLAVLEEQVKTVDKKLDKYFVESREFHRELIDKLNKLDGEKIQIATLKEKVRTLERMTWGVGMLSMAALVNAIIELVTKGAA